MNLYRRTQHYLFGDDHRAGPTLAVIMAGFALCLLHWFQTPVNKMVHDFYAHVDYIEYIAENYAIPEPHLSYAFYHPPLYYIAAAFLYKLTEVLGGNPLVGVTTLSLMFYAIYLIFAARLLMDHVTSLLAYYVGLGVLVFWPLGVNMARMINNDVPLFVCETVGLYYLMHWWKTQQPEALVKALIACAVGMNIKSSAVVLAVTIGVLVIRRILTHSFSLRPFLQRKMVLGLMAAILMAAVPIARSYYYYRIVEIRPASLFFMAGVMPVPDNNIPAEDNAYLDNSPYHFLSFDLVTYLNQPFYNVWFDVGGRQYFWNAVLKTSVVDEFIWKGTMSARVLSAIELAMVLYMGCTLLMMWHRRKPDAQMAVFGLAIAIQLAALTALRIIFPAAWHQEYRFIFATTPLMCVLYAKSIEWWHHQDRNAIAMTGCVLGALFTLESLWFLGVQDL